MSRIALRSATNLTIGLDLGDKRSQLYTVDAAGERREEGVMPTTRAGLTQYFAGGQPVG